MRSDWDGYPPAKCHQMESWHWLQLSASHTGRACTPRPMLWKPAEGVWTNDDLWGDGPIRLSPAEIDAVYISRFCDEPGGGVERGAATVFPVAPPIASEPHLIGTQASLWGNLPPADRFPLR